MKLTIKIDKEIKNQPRSCETSLAGKLHAKNK